MNHLAKIKQLIEDAAECSDLDDSVRLIQDFIDQGDGGVAAMFFQDTICSEQWSVVDLGFKRAMLLKYLHYEYQMAI